MRLIKIGLANANPTVGAFRPNLNVLLDQARMASEAGVAVALYPEGALSGYYPEDLLSWPGFIQGQWEALQLFASITRGNRFPTVHLVGLFVEHEGAVYNTIAAVCGGRIVGGHFKENLPTYGVFYEGRKCSPGRPGFVVDIEGIPFGDVMFEAPFGRFSVDNCEDIWVASDGPLARRAYSGAEINFTGNASPFRIGVMETRRQMLSTRSADNLVVQAYANLVGGNDGLVFDGGGFVFQNGRLLFEGTRWEELLQTCVVDLDAVKTARMGNTTWRVSRDRFLAHNEPTLTISIPFAAEATDSLVGKLDVAAPLALPGPGEGEPPAYGQYFADLEEAIVLGTADYILKTGAFRCLGNALSGGKDSAVTSILLWRVAHRLLARNWAGDGEYHGQDIEQAVRNGYLTLFSFPSSLNSEQTRGLSAALAEELGAKLVIVPIQEDYRRGVEALRQMMVSREAELSKVVLGNIQTRVRFTWMWNWANAVGGFFPQNSNMSEKAVGYCTVGGGDIEGHLSLIANMPKTHVTEFLRYLGRKYGLQSAHAIADSVATAELAEGQSDEKDLMPFPILDNCFALFAGEKLMPHEVYLRLRAIYTDDALRRMDPDYYPGKLKGWVKSFTVKFMRSIFKWVRSPLSVHLGNLDLERERALQIPVVQDMQWLEGSLLRIDAEAD